jgi:hypothetical protein
MKPRPTALDIRRAWEEADAEFGDRSTEFVAAIVADHLGIEYSTVFDALAETAAEPSNRAPSNRR